MFLASAAVVTFLHNEIMSVMCQTDETKDLRCFAYKDARDLRLSSATLGYDIWKSEPWSKYGDPGKRNKIFRINCKDENGYEGYYNFISINPDYNCRKHFSVQRIKTFKEYLSVIGGSNSYRTGIETSAKGGAFGVRFEASAKYDKSGNSEEEKTKRLFEEKNGEILLATASCNTNDVRMSQFDRPMFTRNFIRGLELMNRSLSESEIRQENIVKRFIQEFGTHYMTKVDFGAEMIYEQRFTSRSKDVKQSSSRAKCVKETLNACIGGGFWGSEAKACTNSGSGECTNNSLDEKWADEVGLQSSRMRTIGSELTSNEDWGRQENFRPVPIRYFNYW